MGELTLVVPEGVEDERGWLEGVVRSRERLIPFCCRANSRYKVKPHLELLADALEALERREINRLMTMMPPRHGKSLTASTYFPAWYLCRNPEHSVIMASYGVELGYGFGRAARNVMMNPRVREIFPDVELAPDSRSAHLWHTNQGGLMLSSGIPGPITGRGADYLGVDDPIKTIEEANSEVYREKMWNWWTVDAYTRLEPGGVASITATHWHDDDLMGRVLNSEGSNEWVVIKLPAEALEDDLLGRLPGEPLWPERYDEEALAQRKRVLGERNYSALFQQDPLPEGGHVFPRFSTYDVPPSFERIWIAYDTALTDELSSDYNAWAAWGEADGRAYLIRAGQIRAEQPEALKRMAMFYREMIARYPMTPVKPIVRRAVHIDRIAAQYLRTWGVPVAPVKMPRGDLLAISRVVSTYVEANQVFVPSYDQEWIEEWRRQHSRFPAAPHDDLVATTVYALWRMFRYRQTGRRRRSFDLYDD